MTTRLVLTFCWAVMSVATPAPAERICGTDSVLDVSGVPILPFGGEILGASTLEGTITGTQVDVTFVAEAPFDAADLGMTLVMPIDGASGSVAFTGAQLGWSGQGTFTASFASNGLDGDLSLPRGQGFYTWFIAVSNLNPGAGPISGSLDVLTYTLGLADCPVGDLDGDIIVGTSDLLILLAAWGPCGRPGCAGDLDGDGVVGTSDLLLLLAGWGDHFCPAPLC